MRALSKIGSCGLVAIAAMLGQGCFNKSYCEKVDNDAPYCQGDGGGGAGASTATTQAMASGSSSTGLPDGCDPSMLADGQGIAASCGLFVEPGKTGGDGSQASPFGTLGEALAASSTKPIYVCSTSAEGLDEAATVSSQSLLGKLECATWKVSTTKTAWTAPANAPVLTLSSPSNIAVSGFAIMAREATGFDSTTLQGNSSVGVLVDGGVATLTDLDIATGKGAAGGHGLDETAQAPGRNSNATKFNGVEGGDCGLGPGVLDPIADCPTGGTTQAGDGGGGNHTLGGGGNPGTPDPGLGDPNGDLGMGQPATGAWDCSVNGGNGEAGHPGPGGAEKAGAKGSLLGTISLGSIYAGDAGHAGEPGVIGQGGGGGGGRKGDGNNGCGATTKGPSGGSGGAGGCGGLAGGGGGAGGGSIALISLSAALTLTNIHLTSAVGGVGGAGGDGQLGGNGGLGGPGGGNACIGGGGGNGGDGGPGGGGRGGPSIGLASTGTAPELDDAEITIATQGAAGGDGGNANVAPNKGDDGALAKKQGF